MTRSAGHVPWRNTCSRYCPVGKTNQGGVQLHRRLLVFDKVFHLDLPSLCNCARHSKKLPDC